MRQTEASTTAIGAASMRAAHLVLDADPKIFRDEFAMRLSGFESEAHFRDYLNKTDRDAGAKMGAEIAQRLFRSVRASIVVRSRFTEDAFAEAMKRGVNHIVILGAGLDSFAWRRPDLAKSVQVFEIDHPASQQWKRTRLRELGLTEPANLTFIPIDFEKQTLLEGLRKGGFPMDKPGFFSWLGVTNYLTRETVLETFKQVASLAPNTEISFTFRIPPNSLSERDQQIAAAIKSSVASANEPFLSAFEPAELAARMRELGYTHVKHFSPAEADAAYFVSRSDGLASQTVSHLMLARV